MGRIFVVELEGRSYRCKFCKTHLALADDLVSRAFHSRRGKAYLFNKARQPMKRARNTRKGSSYLKGSGLWTKPTSSPSFTASSLIDAEDV